MSQFQTITKKLEESQKTIAELRAALGKAQLSDNDQHLQQRDNLSSERPSASPSSFQLDNQGVVYPSNRSRPDLTNSETASEEGFSPDLSLDENGKLRYIGRTSAMHASPLAWQARTGGGVKNLARPLSTSDSGTSTTLGSGVWDNFAIGNAAIQTDVPQPLIARLLEIHQTWVSPTFNWMYYPVFMRDVALCGPYYTPFLLTVICAHAARFEDPKISELLISKACLLLGVEIQRESNIPTAQALLQLSARELAYGLISQAWLYSGMAFRMVGDLGLHHSTATIATLGNMTKEDLAIRRRLFWSCYFWDKAIMYFSWSIACPYRATIRPVPYSFG